MDGQNFYQKTYGASRKNIPLLAGEQHSYKCLNKVFYALLLFTGAVLWQVCSWAVDGLVKECELQYLWPVCQPVVKEMLRQPLCRLLTFPVAVFLLGFMSTMIVEMVMWLWWGWTDFVQDRIHMGAMAICKSKAIENQVKSVMESSHLETHHQDQPQVQHHQSQIQQHQQQKHGFKEHHQQHILQQTQPEQHQVQLKSQQYHPFERQELGEHQFQCHQQELYRHQKQPHQQQQNQRYQHQQHQQQHQQQPKQQHLSYLNNNKIIDENEHRDIFFSPEQQQEHIYQAEADKGHRQWPAYGQSLNRQIFTSFGQIVELNLSSMQNEQALLAQKRINNILYKGSLNALPLVSSSSSGESTASVEKMVCKKCSSKNSIGPNCRYRPAGRRRARYRGRLSPALSARIARLTSAVHPSRLFHYC